MDTLLAARDHLQLDAALLAAIEPQDGLVSRLAALCRRGGSRAGAGPHAARGGRAGPAAPGRRLGAHPGIAPHSIVDSVWSSVAIDSGAGWHSGNVMDATQLIVLDPAFASELDNACQAAMAHALLLDAKSLAAPARFGRWFGAAAPIAEPALTSAGRSVEGPGLSP